MDASFVSAILFVLIAAVSAFFLSRGAVILAKLGMEWHYDAKDVREILIQRSLIEATLLKRRANLKTDVRRIDAELETLVRRRQGLERSLVDPAVVGDIPVRELGDQVIGVACYIAEVYNKYVAQCTPESPHPIIEAGWADSQVLEVWADSPSDAQVEIEKRYPENYGYILLSLVEVPNSRSVPEPPKRSGRGR
ncbi:putative LemA family protein [Azospirillaceae bacterium]